MLDHDQLFPIATDISRAVWDCLEFAAILLSETGFEELLLFLKGTSDARVVSAASIIDEHGEAVHE